MSLQSEAQLKSYQKRLRDDITSITDNFSRIMATVKSEPDPTLTTSRLQSDCYEMCCRAANICRAAESLVKLIWDIKQFLIINDFPLINESISKRVEQNVINANEIDNKLVNLKNEIALELYELEDEYYHSLIK